MTPSQAIGKILSGDSATVALRGTRYFDEGQPVTEGVDLPFQVCSELDSDFNHHLEDMASIAHRSLQLDHFGTSSNQVAALAEAARKALNVFRGTVTDTTGSLVITGLRIQDESAEQATADTAQASGVSRKRQEWLMTFTLA